MSKNTKNLIFPRMDVSVFICGSIEQDGIQKEVEATNESERKKVEGIPFVM